MGPLKNCIINRDTKKNPIWLMRQAGRYLPEFREIRKENQDFIKLCLNKKLSSEITLQPIRRFDFDAAIIFSDILMLPYGLGQEVRFEKNLGPKLGDLEINKILNSSEEAFTETLKDIYSLINITSKNEILKQKDLIGFAGAPWTILVYMINKTSPKKGLSNNFYDDKEKIKILLKIIVKFLKLHIKNQINAGSSVIQLFDSWAGLVDDNNIEEYIYNPTAEIVDYVKSLKVPIICFPRNIKNYRKYTLETKPDVINIDYSIDPKIILDQIKIPVQGGLDPKILLSGLDNVKKETVKYLSIFKNHPYIFNLGHGVLPETNPNTVEYLVKLVRDFK